MNYSIYLRIATLAFVGVNIIHAEPEPPFSGRLIINGRDAKDGEFPYQVSIQRKAYYGDASFHECGASIIDEHHVITAAHCVVLMEPTEYVIVAGTRDFSKPTDSNRVNISIAQVYYHEHFDYQYYVNDIAILRVAKSFPVTTDYVKPIALRKDPLETPAQCVVTGWGSVQVFPQEFPDMLQALDVPLINQNACELLYNDYEYGFIAPGMLCAGYLQGVMDACKRDSGSPLACDGKLTGIVSWGNGCAIPNYPGVYVDITHYSEWIRETLARSYADGGLQFRFFY